MDAPLLREIDTGQPHDSAYSFDQTRRSGGISDW